MGDRVRRGLGLVVVAVIAILVALLAAQGDSAGADMVRGLAGAVTVVAGFVGLAMVAVGLLRD